MMYDEKNLDNMFNEDDTTTLLKFNKNIEKEKKKESKEVQPKNIFENFKKMVVKKIKKPKTKY